MRLGLVAWLGLLDAVKIRLSLNVSQMNLSMVHPRDFANGLGSPAEIDYAWIPQIQLTSTLQRNATDTCHHAL